MKKIRQILKDNKWIILLTLFFIGYILIITMFGKYIYGSQLDWNCQHYYIPDYFRKLFYKTGKILPSFAPNIGAGQNIYNLSYYGLLNPVILISYFLPFISMKTYLQISSIVLIYASIILFYKWISTKFDKKVSIIATIIFLLATPLLFQSHRHIMFVNYMPFLILGLMGVDKYFTKRKKSLLIFSVFLITMTSYFFSVGALVTLCIYWLYMYIKLNSKFEFKRFIRDGFKFLYPILVGVASSVILLLPTFMAILNGRGESSVSVDYLALFIPKIIISNILYSPYSPGLTSIVLFSLIYLIIRGKRERKVLSIILSIIIVFPIFVFVLNAGMYVNGKVLIPFIPLFILVIAHTLDEIIMSKNISIVSLIVYVAICILICLNFNFSSITDKVILLDLIFTIIAILLFIRFKKEKLFIFMILFLPLIAFVICNRDENLVLRGTGYSLESTNKLVDYIQKNDDEYYRISNMNGGLGTANDIVNSSYNTTSIYSSVSNQDYQNFYYNLIGNNILNRSKGQLSVPKNILFNVFMSNKYIISSSRDNLYGYNKIKEVDGNSVYKNDLVLPLGYSTNKLMSKHYFEKLSYPYNAEAMLNYVIVDGKVSNFEYKTNINKIDLDYEMSSKTNVDILENDGYIQIESKDNGKIILDLKNDLSNKLLFIKLELLDSNSCSIGDNLISINNISNKLTCKSWKYHNKNYSFEYTISEANLKQLNIKFTKGTYKIKNIEVYSVDYDKFVDSYSNDKSKFVIQKHQEDLIEGKIKTEYDGYFRLGMPYDKGFEVYVDENKVDVEKVNESFVGFRLKKGNHNIKIMYTPPMLNISKAISVMGIILFLSNLYIEESFKISKKKYK